MLTARAVNFSFYNKGCSGLMLKLVTEEIVKC